MSNPYNCVCTECGSDRLRYEAWVEWNVEAQDFVFAGHIDDGVVWCDDCEDEVEGDIEFLVEPTEEAACVEVGHE